MPIRIVARSGCVGFAGAFDVLSVKKAKPPPFFLMSVQIPWSLFVFACAPRADSTENTSVIIAATSESRHEMWVDGESCDATLIARAAPGTVCSVESWSLIFLYQGST